MKDQKLTFVEDCPNGNDVDTDTTLPSQSKKRVNFATKLPQSRESYSATDSGYQGGGCGRNISQKRAYERGNIASPYNEAKSSSKGLGRERFFWNRQPSKEDVKLPPTRQKRQVAFQEAEVLSAGLRDLQFEEGKGVERRIFDPCYCLQCQRAFFTQATATRLYFPHPSPGLQSPSWFPSISSGLPADTKTSHLNWSDAPSIFDVTPIWPGRGDIEAKRMSCSQLNSDIGIDYSSYPQWPFPGIEYSLEEDSYAKGPAYVYLGPPLNYVGLPSYQLPLYAPDFPPPLPSETLAQLYNRNPEQIGHWWPPDWSPKGDLDESNHKHLSQINNELHVLGSLEASKQLKSHYTPPWWPAQTYYSAPHPTAPNSGQNTSAKIYEEKKPLQTRNGTHKGHSRSLSYPLITPKTAAPFVSTKNTRRQSFSSKKEKSQMSIPNKDGQSHQQNDRGEQNVQGSSVGDRSNPMRAKKLPQKSPNRVNETTEGHLKSKSDLVGHNTGVQKSNQRSNNCHKSEKKQQSTVDETQRGSKPLPLTKEALAKLNKEHGDDIDTKVQGVCRANSSRSTIFDDKKVVTRNSGKTKKKGPA